MEIFDLIDRKDIAGIKQLTSRSKHVFELRDYYGNTPLLKASYLGFTDVVEALLNNGANVRDMNYFGQNALTLASYCGNVDIINKLLGRRTYEDFTLSSMIPPLCVAILRKHKHIIQMYWKMSPPPEAIKTCHGVGAIWLHSKVFCGDVDEDASASKCNEFDQDFLQVQKLKEHLKDRQ